MSRNRLRVGFIGLGSQQTHVNLILWGPPEVFTDPDRLLEGGGKGGRHLKVRTLEDLPRTAARAWIQIATARARAATR